MQHIRPFEKRFIMIGGGGEVHHTARALYGGTVLRGERAVAHNRNTRRAATCQNTA